MAYEFGKSRSGEKEHLKAHSSGAPGISDIGIYPGSTTDVQTGPGVIQQDTKSHAGKL
jgi:hypothetical protein